MLSGWLVSFVRLLAFASVNCTVPPKVYNVKQLDQGTERFMATKPNEETIFELLSANSYSSVGDYRVK
jgi:hypothetical protein